jgi:CheY-like chemotaxis protein
MASKPSSAPAPRSEPDREHKALIVEDDPAVIDQVVEVLDSLEHTWDTACSQHEAAKRIGSCEYSYVLLDIEIPARSRTGTPRIQNVENLLEKIHAVRNGSSPPVIVLSDYVAQGLDATEGVMRLAMSLRAKGAADLIKKPFPTAGRTLDRVIKKVLGLAAGRLPRPVMPPGDPEDGAADANADWLTVTQAAELLVHDLPGLDLKRARARVSVSAGRDEFGTNGRKGKSRRIDRHSFSTWRLAQRDRDLDAED